MTVLTDYEIISLSSNNQMVVPFDPNLIKTKKDDDGIERSATVLVQPASLDIRIGLTAKRLLPPDHADFDPNTPRFKDIDFSNFSEKHPYLFMPGERLLVASLETFNMPKSVCAQVVMRSTPARAFIQHINAGWIDPGWHGSVLTMELVNWGHTPFALYPGLSITQIVFHWLNDVPTTVYYGKYNGDRTVEGGK